MTLPLAHEALDELLTAWATRTRLWHGLQSGVTDRAPFDTAVVRVDCARKRLDLVVRATVVDEARGGGT